MHFITGGAFNGKRAWVKNKYHFTEKDQWISAYTCNALPWELTDIGEGLVVLEGIELWLKPFIEQYDLNVCRERWRECLHGWETWERACTNRQLVVIGTDITKGIVPIEKENRLWRDLTGWAYQDLAAISDKVELIWYGLNQTIKADKEKS